MALKARVKMILIISRFLLIFTGLIRQINSECSVGWVANQVNNVEYCYKIGTIEEGSWMTAYFSCLDEGANLLWIENDNELNWINNLINRNSLTQPEDGWAIGAHRYLYNPDAPSWADGTFLSPQEF